MDGDVLSANPCVLHDGGAGDVASLGKDVEFAKAVEFGGCFERGEFLAVGAGEGADAGEPVVDHAVAEVFEGGLDATAAVVAADDDVFYLEHIDGVLEDGEEIEIGFLDDVGDVAVDEDFAGGEAGDLVGGDARVGAADPEVFR